MSAVLGIDTAGPVVGAAVVGWGPPRQWSCRIVRGADGVLLPAIADLVAPATPLAGVAVSVGPGAFTGLRVGVATALGIAVSRGVPVICVSSPQSGGVSTPKSKREVTGPASAGQPNLPLRVLIELQYSRHNLQDAQRYPETSFKLWIE